MENKKYELIKNDTVVNGFGTTLYRIKALMDFGDVKKGDLGGYIEKEENLSQEGNCWVFGNAQVSDWAQVVDNAQVFGDAQVYCDAKVSDDARVSDNARIFEHANVSGNAQVFGDAKVYGHAKVYDSANIFGISVISGNATVCGEAKVYGIAAITYNAYIQKDTDFIIVGPIDQWSDYIYLYINKENNVVCSYRSQIKVIGHVDDKETNKNYLLGYIDDAINIYQNTRSY